MKKRIISFVTALVLLIGLVPGSAFAAESDSGEIGSGIKWEYDGFGTLSISGNGEIPDYSHEWELTPAPWWNYRNDITTIVVGDGVRRIGNEAFGGGAYREGYPQLTSITLPSSVEEIGDYAFSGAGRLSKCTLPDSVVSIGNGAFYGSALQYITIPESVEEISETAFSSCVDLIEINVSAENDYYLSDDGVLYQKFYGDQYALMCYPAQKTSKSYSVLPGTTEILYEAFANNTNLSSVDLPSGVQTISDFAFLFCENLQSISLPDGITAVSSSAFCGCTALQELHIPSSVEDFTSEYSAGEWTGPEFYPLSVYFYGNTAPKFDTEIVALREAESYVTIYYPSYATGWDAVQQQTDVQNAVKYGGLKFRVWTPEEGGDPVDPPETDKFATILQVYPVDGSTDVGYDAGNQPHFEITFDRDICSVSTRQGYIFADLDFSKGSMKIFRASDNMLIYEVTYDDYMNDLYDIEGTVSGDTEVRNGTTLVLDPFNAHTLLDPGTEYYITVDEGFIRFEDGTVNPPIGDHEWQFATETTTFTFLGFDGKTEREYEYHFSESFFTSPSTFYDHELAKMSLNLALSAFNSSTAAESGYTRQEAAKNVIDLMQNIGFKEVDVSSYEGKPTRYSIAEAIGQKQIKDHSQEYTLIAVAIRGGGYEREWASNVSVFSDIEHQGFSLAANDVMNDLLQYINQYVDDTEHIKLWITGYSRGAAVANLMSAKLSQQLKNGNFGNLSIDQNDIYTYTFATPMSRAADGYSISTIDSNIFNIISPVDIVPKFTPDVWGYYRYGYTYCLPSIETNSNTYYDHIRNVAVEVTRIAGRNYAGTFSKSQGAILQDVVDLLGVMEPDGTISITIQNELANYFEDKYSSSSKDNGFKDFITDVKDVIDTAGTLKDVAEMNVISLSIDKLLKPAIVDGGIETLEMVLDITARAHYPEVYLAWMNTIEEDDLTNGTYRKMYFNCPVDISVYDENNTFVAGFRDDKAINIDDEAVDAYLDANGQKVIVLPMDREYTFAVIATDGGSMTYTVEEQSTAYNQVERIVSYYDVNLNLGDQFIGAVTKNPSTETEYPLFKKTNEGQEKLIPSVDQDKNTVEKFDVAINVIGNGTAVGAGTYINGKFVQATAVANKNEDFVGWYKDQTLLSENTEYRFLVDGDITITAKFTSNQEISDEDPTPDPAPSPDVGDNDDDQGGGDYLISVDRVSGGRVTVQPGRADKGDTVTINVYPNDGYELDELVVTDSRGNEIDPDARGSNRFTFTMPGSKVNVEASFVREGGQSQTPQTTFMDVPASAWYYDAVEYVYENGLMSGVSSGRFAPDDTLTRAMLVQTLYAMEGRPSAASAGFADVASGDWYASAVNWAAANGVISGVSETSFAPNSALTREQLALILYRYAQYKGYDVTGTSSLAAYADGSTVSGWAAEAMSWAINAGLISGVGGNQIAPTGTATRAQVAQILMNFRESVAQ